LQSRWIKNPIDIFVENVFMISKHWLWEKRLYRKNFSQRCSFYKASTFTLHKWTQSLLKMVSNSTSFVVLLLSTILMIILVHFPSKRRCYHYMGVVLKIVTLHMDISNFRDTYNQHYENLMFIYTLFKKCKLIKVGKYMYSKYKLNKYIFYFF